MSERRQGRLGFNAGHSNETTHIAHDLWILLRQGTQFFEEKLAETPRVPGQIVALDHVQNPEGDRASQRRSAKRGRVRAGREQVCMLFAYPKCADRKSTT